MGTCVSYTGICLTVAEAGGYRVRLYARQE